MPKNILLKLLLFIFLPLNLSLSAPAAVSAQTQDSSLVIQPSKVEIKASPGQKISESFSVINRSNFIVKLKLVVKDYKQVSEDGKLEFYNAEKEQAPSWLIPQYLEITLKPLSIKDINFIVSVPEDFSPGGHYGAILFEPSDGNASNVNINASNFGELVLLTVTNNEAKANAIAKTISFGASGIQKGNPINFSFKAQNTGNSHFVTQGRVVVKNWFGKEIGNFNTGQLIVYPGTSRIFKWRWTDTPSFGIFRANLMLSDPSSKMEPYKIVDSTWFIVFPWQIALLVLLSASAVFAILKYRKEIALKLSELRKRTAAVRF